MRRMIISEWQPKNGDLHKVDIGYGWFHLFITVDNVVSVVLELDDKTIKTVPIDMVRFG